MNLLSHVLTALTLGEVLNLELLTTILGAIVPDIDYMLGIGHRTVMHSALFLLVIMILFYKHRRSVTSFAIGYLSHLILDIITTQGIQLLWPLKTYFGYGLFNSLDNNINLAVIIITFILLWNKEIIKYKLMQFEPKKIRFTLYFIFASILLFAIPFTYAQLMSCTETTISELLSNPSEFNEVCVIVEGTICSEIEMYSGYNNYQVFDFCSNEKQIVVWKLETINENELNEGNNITITGLFTIRYLNSSGYELYKIKDVNFS